MVGRDARTPILYLAPWVDIGGADKGTIDWFRFLDRDRFRPSLITTQPSPNRRLCEVAPYTDEVWDLPQLMSGSEAAHFIITFIRTRGVRIVHMMNSRLGFELLPEIACIPDPPVVVVQLHVEEPDRSGYVRYVATRFGGLVDAFSVSSQALSERLGDYGIPRVKRRVIRTGVDAEREFSPGRVTPLEGLAPDRLQILFPARVTAQKNPLLMASVASRLRAAGLRFQIHCLGDGEMMPALRRQLAHAKLKQHVILHGDQQEMAPWYAACDVVLLTSEFEGVPYVAYEAMAMAKPFVGPKLPGLVELITDETGVLVAPTQGADGYAAALRQLAGDPQRRRQMGRAARARALSDHSLARMGSEHGALYVELRERLPPADRAGAEAVGAEDAPFPPTPALRSRRPGDRPLVSVIVPCFNHGRFLNDCLDSIAQQDYEPLEVIVVDDGSTDPDTQQALAQVERDGVATVLRLPINGGPSAARNAALDHVGGRYVLPVDADNILLPGAVTALVDQLSTAGERIGFVFPNSQYFGNRSDYYEPPSYNLVSLLSANYCDTCSLIDREVLDRGFRYPEDIVLGHEDWDLVLSLAEHGVHGEPAHARTLLFRKQGLSRSDLVQAARTPFAEVVARRHPRLFAPAARARIKSEWSPAITVIALDPLPAHSDDALANVITGAARQTCQDFELVIQTAEEGWPTELGRRLRRVPSALAASSRGRALAYGLEISRGRWALAAYRSPGALLADPTLIEKALRPLDAADPVDAIAFADAGPRVAPFRLLDSDGVQRATLHAVCWPTLGSTSPPRSLELADDRPLESLAGWLSAHARLQWRHVAQAGHSGTPAGGDGRRTTIGGPWLARARDAAAREVPPALPGRDAGIPAHLRPGDGPWPMAQFRLLCRHYEPGSGVYRLTNDTTPPDGHVLQHVLGCVRAVALEGTVSLTAVSDGDLPVALGESCDLEAPDLLGFVEQTHLPLLDPLLIGRLRSTGQHILIAGDDDPLADSVDVVREIGFIEGYPAHPRQTPRVAAAYGLVGLVRTVDHAARRNRYGAGQVPPGRLAGELGALLTAPTDDAEPLWIDAAGRVHVEGLRRPGARPSPVDAIRWVADPLTWRGFSSPGPRLRATGRRAFDAVRACAAGSGNAPSSASGAPAGYLLRSPGGSALPLFGALHPVTGDQMLSTREGELHALGYTDIALLGYLSANAPVTGRLGTDPIGQPWARHFGTQAGAA